MTVAPQETPEDLLTATERSAPAAHAEAVHAIASVLRIGAPRTWHLLSEFLRSRLTATERAGLAWAILGSLTPRQVAIVVDAIPSGHQLQRDRSPLPPLFDATDEAASWTAFATEEEVDAYALACFRAMTRDRQAGFMAYLTQYAAG